MKKRHIILIANILLLVLGLVLVNMIGKQIVDNYNGQTIFDKILSTIVYAFALYLSVFIILSIFSIIGFFVAKRQGNKELKIGFGISFLFNLFVLLFSFILSYL